MGAPQKVFRHGFANPGVVLFLRQGQWWFGSREEGVQRLSTVLGSCVAVTLWHPRLGLGGMCHFLVPQRSGSIMELDGRYGDEAIELLVRALGRAGTSPRDYETGLFGGANMFAGDPKVTIDVGAHNVHVAEQLLEHHGFVPRQVEVLGTEHRQLTLDLNSGAIAMRAGVAA